MERILIPAVIAAGLAHWILVLVSFLLPDKLGYHENMEKVSLIIRQIFKIQHELIRLVLLAFGSLGVFFAEELVSGSPLGTFLCATMAVFWSFRLAVQLFYYDPELRRQHRLGDLAYIAVFVFQSVVFTIATAKGVLS